MNRKAILAAAASMGIGLLLAASLASPATASTPGVAATQQPTPERPSAIQPSAIQPSAIQPSAIEPSAIEPSAIEQRALARYLVDSTSASKLAPPASSVQVVRSVDEVEGKRIIHTRGSAQLWTQNTLEWYWNSSKITSSTGWQAVGYIFPNTAREKGISRTYKSNSAHNWRGIVTIGIGAPTPWGDVDVYSSTVVDTYQLKRGGGFVVD